MSVKKIYKKQYKQMFSLVQVVINRWDPYSLLEGGAPEDEFESEIASVVARIKTIKTGDMMPRKWFQRSFLRLLNLISLQWEHALR